MCLSLYFTCASACTSRVPQPVLHVCLSLYFTCASACTSRVPQPVLHVCLSLYFTCASACTSRVPQPVLHVCLSLCCTYFIQDVIAIWLKEQRPGLPIVYIIIVEKRFLSGGVTFLYAYLHAKNVTVRRHFSPFSKREKYFVSAKIFLSVRTLFLKLISILSTFLIFTASFCGGHKRGHSGSFHTSGGKTECHWLLQVNQGKKVTIQISNFNMGDNDRVEIYDGQSYEPFITFRKNASPRQITGNSHFMRVIYIGGDNPGSGFSLNFKEASK